MAASTLLRKGMQLMHASPVFEAIEHYTRTADSEIIAIPLNPAFACDTKLGLAYGETTMSGTRSPVRLKFPP